MAVILSKPPVRDSPIKGIKSWISWFNNLFDFVTKSQIVLDKQSISSATSSITFTSGLTSRFTTYRIDISNLTVSAASTLFDLLISTDKGVTYKTGATDYDWGTATEEYLGAMTSFANSTGDDSLVPLELPAKSTAGYVLNGEIKIYNPADTTQNTMLSWALHYLDTNGQLMLVNGTGRYLTAAAVNGIKLVPTSGTINTGEFTLVGVN